MHQPDLGRKKRDDTRDGEEVTGDTEAKPRQRQSLKGLCPVRAVTFA